MKLHPRSRQQMLSFLSAFVLAAAAFAEPQPPLEGGFRSPPASARPWVYWYWMSGNIAREGLTADLEAMKQAGIGGAMIFNIGDAISGPVTILSPEWRELMRYAICEAGRLGIEIALNNSATGWSSSGGPWITPELAMQRVTWSETTVSGDGMDQEWLLPSPPTRLGVYRDVAVLAFPTPEAEQVDLSGPAVTASDPGFQKECMVGKNEVVGGWNWDESPAIKTGLLGVAGPMPPWVQFTYGNPVQPRSLHAAFAGTEAPHGVLEQSDDGLNWRQVRPFQPRNRAPVDVVFEAPPARHWRVRFETQKPVKLSALRLGADYRIEEWTGKAMFNAYGLDKPPFTHPGQPAPESCVIPRGRLLDLTDRMDASGRLKWQPPQADCGQGRAKRWTILRFGYTPTGSKICPAARGGDGLECDKLNPAALDVHFQNSLQPFFDDPTMNRIVKYVHVDSYERGAQNWTAALPMEFKNRRGYDLRPWLPALTGRVVGNVQDSERFLWDFRHTITSLMHENYFGHMRELCRKTGKQFTCEPYHQTQFNNVTAGGKADIPMCEAWMGPGIPAPYWMKLGASPAHVYGKQIVGAESFTAPESFGGDWNTDFWDMKELGDAMFCGGVNLMVFHVYAHQPWTKLVPGQTLGGIGTHFERSNTWWGQMPAFTGYISRCQNALQKGRFVADALYFCGENSPNESVAPSGEMLLPRGYDYDVCDADVIHNRLRVQDGKLTLPEGGSYRLLVLPDDAAMTPEMVRRIGELVQAGATVVGPKPSFSPSLENQPAADARVRALAEAIWGDCDGVKVTERAHGSGRIFRGRPLSRILADCVIPPDVETPAEKPLIRHLHRELKEGQLYFLASSSTQPQAMDVTFRVGKGVPQLWDPVTGETRLLPEFRRESGRTVAPLQFDARQSYFVFFGAAGPATKKLPAAKANFPEIKPMMELAGAWELSFDPGRGGPSQVTFQKLEDWSKRPEEGIKYYSGKGTYRKDFDLPQAETRAGERIFLDLGKVKNVAQIRLNGQELGTVWCAPWRVEITSALKSAGNHLEIDVVNLWPNRMIGDEQLPEDCLWNGNHPATLQRWPDWLLKGTPRPSGRHTFSTVKFWRKDSPLLESGLLGPVRVMWAH